MKKAVCEAKPTSADQLWEIVRDLWATIPVERYQKLVDALPCRCEAVIKNNDSSGK